MRIDHRAAPAYRVRPTIEDDIFVNDHAPALPCGGWASITDDVLVNAHVTALSCGGRTIIAGDILVTARAPGLACGVGALRERAS